MILPTPNIINAQKIFSAKRQQRAIGQVNSSSLSAGDKIVLAQMATELFMSDEELKDHDRLEMIALAENLGRDIAFKKDHVELNLNNCQGLWHLLRAIRYLSGELETDINTSIPIDINNTAPRGFYLTTIKADMSDHDLQNICSEFHQEENKACSAWLETPKGRRSQMHLVTG